MFRLVTCSVIICTYVYYLYVKFDMVKYISLKINWPKACVEFFIKFLLWSVCYDSKSAGHYQSIVIINVICCLTATSYICVTYRTRTSRSRIFYFFTEQL